MERLKQTIAKLENDVAELKHFQTKIQGSTQSKGDLHYCTSTQEFGEYTLDEIDTFRFSVTYNSGMYAYRLRNPTPELSAYLQIQGKAFNTVYIHVGINNFEEYCMKNGGTPFVLTDEIRKCLDSKLWEFVCTPPAHSGEVPDYEATCKIIPAEFYIDIPITFKNTYTISPHVSFYITPQSNMLDETVIHEITTKQVVFRVKYGNVRNPGKNATYPNTVYSGLKLHYKIHGIVIQNDNLLD
jgi:hypothetical protein